GVLDGKTVERSREVFVMVEVKEEAMTSVDECVSNSELVNAYLDQIPYQEKTAPALVAQQKTQIKDLLIANNAVLVAHYYTDPEVQALAEETGGVVADSLEMARFGKQHPAQTL